MAWNICLIENTIVVTRGIAADLYAAQQAGKTLCCPWENENEIINWHPIRPKGVLHFEYDHMEHMDFLWDAKIQEILKQHEVEGVVKFGSLEGDNEGKFWGYEFDGKGGLVELKGTIEWSRAIR